MYTNSFNLRITFCNRFTNTPPYHSWEAGTETSKFIYLLNAKHTPDSMYFPHLGIHVPYLYSCTVKQTFKLIESYKKDLNSVLPDFILLHSHYFFMLDIMAFHP